MSSVCSSGRRTDASDAFCVCSPYTCVLYSSMGLLMRPLISVPVLDALLPTHCQPILCRCFSFSFASLLCLSIYSLLRLCCERYRLRLSCCATILPSSCTPVWRTPLSWLVTAASKEPPLPLCNLPLCGGALLQDGGLLFCSGNFTVLRKRRQWWGAGAGLLHLSSLTLLAVTWLHTSGPDECLPRDALW
jgi:hypothetical protein